ncbi:MAG: hypothetical protein U0325_28650 [Polyangiales bacterium]
MIHRPPTPRARVLASLFLVAGCGATAVRADTDSGLTPSGEAAVPNDAGLRGDAGSLPVDVPVVTPVDVPVVTPVDVPVVTPVDVPVVMPVDVPVVTPVDAEAPTPCDPANHGLRCGPVGMGCGGGGGGVCSPSSSCTCDPDQRWRCTVTVPAGCDGGVAPVDAGTGPMCGVAGTWRASIGSESVYFVFTREGQWRGLMSPGGPALVEGTYALAGDEITFTSEMTMSSGGCQPTDRGRYRLMFLAGCAELTLGRISEDCGPRGETLSVLRFVRQ